MSQNLKFSTHLSADRFPLSTVKHRMSHSAVCDQRNANGHFFELKIEASSGPALRALTRPIPQKIC
jgi:hypothetical protein